ncbi:MAG: MipA/OmpV family protein [Rubrivivax sp.]
MVRRRLACRTRHALGAVGVAAGIGAPAPALADAPLWELGLGAAALRLPYYRGADQSRNWLLPMPYLALRGRVLRADREGARAMLVDSARFEVDLSATASPPTASGVSDARAGMPDLAPTVELGPNASLLLARAADWKLELRLPLRAAFTLRSAPRQIGWTASPNLNLDLWSQDWNLGAQLAAPAGDRRLHAYYYDVAPAYATAARPAYRAAAGRAGWQATLSATRRHESLWFGAFVRADTLAGAAFAASPLVRRRSDLSFGLAFAWIFAASAQRAAP